ncbi:OSBP2 isoform 13, partial [Pan troglodytes]
HSENSRATPGACLSPQHSQDGAWRRPAAAEETLGVRDGHQACRDFLELAEIHSRKWQRALQYEQEQRVHLEETIEQLAKQHNSLERAFHSAPGRPTNPSKSFIEGSLLTPKGEDSEEDEDTEYFDAMEDSTSFITVITEAKEDSRKAEGSTGTSSVDWSSADNGSSKVKRRVRIPNKPNYSLNLWSIMKNCIGREL